MSFINDLEKKLAAINSTTLAETQFPTFIQPNIFFQHITISEQVNLSGAYNPSDHNLNGSDNVSISGNRVNYNKSYPLINNDLMLIEQFFSLFSSDDETRRIRFWQKQCNLQGCYIALGNYFSQLDYSEINAFRALFQKNLLILKSAGSAQNNAIILQYKHVTVVDFSLKGHSAYIFNNNMELPFSLSDEVNGNSNELKNQQSPAFISRFRYHDTKQGVWETRLQAILDQQLL